MECKLKIMYLENYNLEEWGPVCKAKPGDAAFDVRAAIPEPWVLVQRSHIMTVPTGIKVEPTPGYALYGSPRSGLARKHGISIVNSPGIIDNEYRGEIMVILINLGNHTYTIQPGERIAQVSVLPIPELEIEAVESVGLTERGEGGFGSTGR